MNTDHSVTTRNQVKQQQKNYVQDNDRAQTEP